MAVNISELRDLTLTIDVDADGVVDPGDTVQGKIRVTNSGTTDATGVQVTDTLTGLTLVANSVKVTPIAFDDAFSITGNTPITFTAAQLLGNDNDPDGAGGNAGLTITGVSGAVNGTIVDNGNGTYTFTPTTGLDVNQTASFQYTVTDAQGLQSVTTGAVNLTVSDVVWYVDSAYGGANGASDGSYLRPYTALTQLNGVTGDGTTNDDVDSAGETIFVYNRGSSYSGGITLESGQKFYGDGQALTVNGLAIGASASNSTIAGTVNLGTGSTGNTLSGFDISSGASTGLTGTTVGTLVVNNVGITTTTGAILNLSGGTSGGIAFNALTSGTVATGPAINIADIDSSTFTTGAVTIGGVTSGSGIAISGGASSAFTFASATIDNTSTDGISLSGANGSVTFTTVDLDGMGGNGVSISGNTNAVNINGGSIGSSNDPAGDGVNINGGSGAITIASSVSKTTGGNVVDITGRTGGTVALSGNLTANHNVAANGAANAGIYVHSNTGGTDTFTGALQFTENANIGVYLTSNTGATINLNPTGAGLDISTSSGTGMAIDSGGTVNLTGSGNTINSTAFTALSMQNTTIGASGLNFQSISSGGGGANGILLNNTGSTAGLTVTGTGTTAGSGGTINNATGDGVSLTNTYHTSLSNMNITNSVGNGISGTNVNGLTIIGNSITGSDSNNIDAIVGRFEAGIRLDNTTGTFALTNTTVSGTNGDNVRLENTTGAMTLDVDGSTIGSNPAATGANGMAIVFTGTASLLATIDNTTFTGNAASGLLTSFGNTSSYNLYVRTSNFTGNNIGADIGGGLSTSNFVLDGNTFTNQISNAINIISDTNSTNAAKFQGIINNNTIGNASVDSGSRDSYGIAIDMRGDVDAIMSVTNNVVKHTDFQGIFIQSRLDNDGDGETGKLDLTLTGNNVGTPDDNSAFPVGFLYSTLVDARNTTTLTANISGNTIAAGVGGAEAIRVRERDTAVFKLERLTDGDATPNEVLTTDSIVQNRVLTDNPGISTVSVLKVLGFTETANGTTRTPNIPAGPAPLMVDLSQLGSPSEDTPPTTQDTATSGSDPLADVTAPSGDGGASETTQSSSVSGLLTDSVLATMIDAAIGRWEAAGASAEQVAAMRAVTFSVVDMTSIYLGESQVGSIQIDNDGGGRGWFVDATPGDDAEFANGVATAEGGAAGHTDLLTVIMHELGHQIGLDDDYDTADAARLMYGYLGTGERREPTATDVRLANGEAVSGAYALSPVNIGTLPAGKSVDVYFNATVNAPPAGVITNPQGTATTSGTNFSSVNISSTLVLDTLTLGNLVFLDVNKNGVFDAGDSGVNGVAVTLFVDTNSNGVFDSGVDTQAATATTAGGGLYSFSGLAAGDYIVRIDAANFTAGGALLGKSSTTNAGDPDNNVDNDSNGGAITGGIVTSQAITLSYNNEPTPGTGNDTNNTLDFGFVTPNQAPTSTNLSGDAATWTENGSAVALDVGGNLTLADADSANFDTGTLTVHIGTGLVPAQDQLLISAVGGVTFGATTVSVSGTQIATYTGGGAGGGDLLFTFNANATPAAVQSLMRAVVFNNSGGEAPTAGSRAITWTLVDGDGTAFGGTDTLTVNSSVNVVSVNDAPSGADKTITFNEDATYTLTASDFGFTDVDNNTLQAVRFTTVTAAGTLFFDSDGPGGAAPIAISAGQFVSVADINAGHAYFVPAANANGTPYTSFTFQVQDNGGTANSGVDLDQSPNTITLNVNSVNDTPVIGNLQGDTVTWTENGAAVVADQTVNATVTDADSTDFNGGSLTVAVTAGAVTAEDVLAIVNQGTGAGQIGVSGANVTFGGTTIGTFTGGSSGTALSVALNASATPAAVQALIRDITYNNTGGENPTAGARTLTWTLVDGDGTANGGVDTATRTSTVTVVAVDDPAVPKNDAVSTAENAVGTGNVFANNGSGVDSDVDGPALAVASVNGSGAFVGTQITLASGAKLTVNADGSYSYDPNGKFNTLTNTSGGETGAVNTSATDTFTYTLTGGGGSATVTMTINGVAGAGDWLAGDAGNNTIVGTASGDLFMLQQGGNDTATGLGADDGFYFGAALTAADSVDGGPGGNDQVGLQGNYAGLTLGANNLVNVETLVFLPGNDTRFGDTSGAFYSYNVTTIDANVAAGQMLTVNWNTLRSGENVTFNGAAETDGSFLTFGGAGNDTITGGAQVDGFYFAGGKFGAGDVLNGGGGNDQLGLQGDYSGGNAITFGAGQLTSIETIVLLSGADTRFHNFGDAFNYTLTMNDGNVAAGQNLTVNANTLRATETLTFNGAAETNGSFSVWGGAGNDAITGGAGADTLYGAGGADNLTGGAGNDTFLYLAATNSTSASRDHILDFTAGDTISLSAIDAIAGGADDAFTFIGTQAFHNTAGELRYQASGGDWLVQGDTNGDGVADFEILLTTTGGHVPAAGDFIL